MGAWNIQDTVQPMLRVSEKSHMNRVIYLKLRSIHIRLCVYIYGLNEVVPLGLTMLPTRAKD